MRHGPVFMYGSAPIYWSSKARTVVAVSIAEAEYIVPQCSQASRLVKKILHRYSR